MTLPLPLEIAVTSDDGSAFALLSVAGSGLLLLCLAGFVIWGLALVSALRIDQRRWAAAGQSQLLWVLVIILLNLFGSILYFAIARPTLRRTPTAPVLLG